MRRLSSVEKRRGRTFLVGLSSGALLVANWRSVLKAGVKTGMHLGLKVQSLAARGAENVADVTHEARVEMMTDIQRKYAQAPPADRKENAATSDTTGTKA